MNYCKRCKGYIKTLELSVEQKMEIWSMKASGLSLFGMKIIQDLSDLNLEESKMFLAHINKEYGECIRCNYSELNSESIECPKCKSFNLNWKINQSFNRKFCIALEYKLCEAFENCGDIELSRFGCDGVNYIPDNITETSLQNISENKIINTQASLGYSGQEKYKMLIKLGKKSFRNYIEELCIIKFIPNKNINDWIVLDQINKTIELQLE